MKGKIKNAAIKASAWIAGFVMLMSACAFDSEPFYIPVFVCLVCTAWLGLLAYANS